MSSEHSTPRERAIKAKVDLLEKLHKTCQLSAIGLADPILNESRYLARALAGVLHFSRETEDYSKSLGDAEHAVSCAVNDAIDILITFVKTSVARIKRDYPKYDLAESPYFEDFEKVLQALEWVDTKTVDSRADRSKRNGIYEVISNSNQLEIIGQFSLKIVRIEARAQAEAVAAKSVVKYSSAWIADTILDALNDPAGQSRFEVHFQPKYDISGQEKKCVGAEALLRLKHGNALIRPDVFIPVAEGTGTIDALGKLVLTETIRFLKGNPKLPSVSINVSTYELLNPAYSTDMIEIIDGSFKGEGTRLELEITEGAALQDKLSFQHLEKIEKCGVKIAIDDFGTGQTRFDYLATLPIKVLKIDQSLIRNFREAPDTWRKLLLSIKAVANVFNLTVVAEGVEHRGEAEKIRDEIGVAVFQGYYFGAPVNSTEFQVKHSPYI